MPRFHLTRHFMLASSLVFLLFGAALLQVDRLRGKAMHAIQVEESRAMGALRTELTNMATEAARRDLVAQHEQSSVDTARVLANGLWSEAFTDFVGQSQSISFQACGAFNPQASASAEEKRQTCLRHIGRQLRNLPGFAAVNAAVRKALHDTPVFRLKIFDRRGITIYSTDHSQIGEDRSNSPGWRTAASEGRAGSRLTRRRELNPLHAETERRDVVNTYLPLPIGDGASPLAVIETYSDVRSFLDQLSAFTSELAVKALAQDQAMQQRLDDERASLDRQGQRATLLLLGLTSLLYLVLLAIVHRGQRLLEQQAGQMQNVRAHMMQAEKMVTLGQMVAGVAHQLNTPLAYCRTNLHCFSQVFARVVAKVRLQRAEAVTVALLEGAEPADTLLEDIAIDRDVEDMHQMLEDTCNGVRMMEELVQQLRSFTRLDQAPTDVVDLNASISSAVYMARAVLSPKIRIEERYSSLPRMLVHVSQINQAVLNLLMNAGQAIAEAGHITVTTRQEARFVAIEVADDGRGMSPEVQKRVFEAFFTTRPEGTGLGLFLVRDIVQAHGGRVALHSTAGKGTRVSLFLPIPGKSTA